MHRLILSHSGPVRSHLPRFYSIADYIHPFTSSAAKGLFCASPSAPLTSAESYNDVALITQLEGYVL